MVGTWGKLQVEGNKYFMVKGSTGLIDILNTTSVASTLPAGIRVVDKPVTSSSANESHFAEGIQVEGGSAINRSSDRSPITLGSSRSRKQFQLYLRQSSNRCPPLSTIVSSNLVSRTPNGYRMENTPRTAPRRWTADRRII